MLEPELYIPSEELKKERNRLSPPFFPAPWAAEWGEDRYGLWQVLIYKEVRQLFRWLEPGTFMMGSTTNEHNRDDDEDYHKVTLTKGFWMADTTVTQNLWLAVMGGNPAQFQDDLQNPVEQVSWNDVQQFLSELNEKIPGMNALLPTEAQWEYGCRAGTTTPFSFGEDITTEEVNYDGNFPYRGGAEGVYRDTTVPVKSLPPNQWGLYEMHGNVWEWCSDTWERNLGLEHVIDPLTAGGGYRVVRGGSWDDRGYSVRSAFRDWLEPDGRLDDLGFRLSPGLIEQDTE